MTGEGRARATAIAAAVGDCSCTVKGETREGGAVGSIAASFSVVRRVATEREDSKVGSTAAASEGKGNVERMSPSSESPTRLKVDIGVRGATSPVAGSSPTPIASSPPS